MCTGNEFSGGVPDDHIERKRENECYLHEQYFIMRNRKGLEGFLSRIGIQGPFLALQLLRGAGRTGKERVPQTGPDF